jgi:hypothetical protein
MRRHIQKLGVVDSFMTLFVFTQNGHFGGERVA